MFFLDSSPFKMQNSDPRQTLRHQDHIEKFFCIDPGPQDMAPLDHAGRLIVILIVFN